MSLGGLDRLGSHGREEAVSMGDFGFWFLLRFGEVELD